MGTAIKHPVPDRVTPSFVIFDIRALWRLGLSVRMSGCPKLQMTAEPGLARCALMATLVNVKGLTISPCIACNPDNQWRQSRWSPDPGPHQLFPLPGSAYWWTRAQFSQNIGAS